MFTGIVKEMERVSSLVKIGNIYRLSISSKSIYGAVKIGDSVSINGVCLTVVTREEELAFDIMEETMRRTSLASLRKGDLVNIEDALKASDPLGGHFVLGHIDCVGAIANVRKTRDSSTIEIKTPKGFAHLIVEKGSIAIDGVSLTVGKIMPDSFEVYLIPHTLSATTFGLKKPGDEVNIEFDIIGKYISRLDESRRGYKITEKFLKEQGFA